MAGIEIPGIYRKFQLLIEYGHVSGWDALAEHFDKEPSTVRGWGQGNGGFARDTLPSRHFKRLLDLLADALPEGTRPDRVRDVALGSPLLLEQALRARAPAALDQLLTSEADRERIRLVRKPTRPGLIELEGSGPDQPILSVPLKASFRLECDTPFVGGHVIAVQQAERLWGFVPAEIDPSGRRILMPGILEDGSPDFMRERTQQGLHRFIVFQTMAAMPILAEMPDRADIVLDYATLAGIVAFYRAQPETKRHLYLVEIVIGPRDDAA